MLCMLDSIQNERFEEPYNNFPPKGNAAIFNKALVKSKLSKNFLKNL